LGRRPAAKTPKVRITFAKHEHQIKLRQPGGLPVAIGHDDAAAGVAGVRCSNSSA
jgi:hypothetical protein